MSFGFHRLPDPATVEEMRARYASARRQMPKLRQPFGPFLTPLQVEEIKARAGLKERMRQLRQLERAIENEITRRQREQADGNAIMDPLPCKIHRLMKVVSLVTDFPILELTSQQRAAQLVKARHILFWLCKRFTSRSYPEIGRKCGGRDHTTVLHGVRRVTKLVRSRGITSPEETPFAWARVLWALDWRQHDQTPA
jgi:hypothetical protein